jgi:anti-sigma factor RsiW
MGCHEWGSALTDWVLDELPPMKVRELEQHIGQCAECARSAQRLGGVRQALINSLTDREMPAHLVLVGEKRQSLFAGFWPALLRTAALSSAAAAIFLVAVSVGFRHGRSWLLPTTARVEPALTRTELQAFVARAVTDQVSLQSKETQAATRELVASLRAEQMGSLARLAQQLQYLELAENAVWKETQQQNEAISLVAHYQQLPTSSPTQPSRR